MPKPRHGSLCTGIGGLDLAAHAVYGGTLAWYSELELAPCVVLEREHPDVPNLGDLTTVDWHTVEPVDVLTAGYPCQPFSHAGKRKGTSDVRHLWPHIAAAVRVLRPGRVVLENVAGHLSLGFGAVLGDLAEAGFDAQWCVFRASDVGAPHQRARLFIVATDASNPGGMGRGSRPGLCEGEPGRLGRGRPRDNDRPAAADPEGQRGSRRVEPRADVERNGLQPAQLGAGADRGHPDAPTPWGQYEPAIRRWEHVLGRTAPAPTDPAGRLAPRFVEWMMGYPEGWTDGLTRTQALKALGNAVVPQQGEAAIRVLAAGDSDA